MPNGKDDVQTLNEIHVPLVKNPDGQFKPVILYISSKDVVHSFKVLAMRIAQDAIPGMRIPIWFRPTRKAAFKSTAPNSAAMATRAWRRDSWSWKTPPSMTSGSRPKSARRPVLNSSTRGCDSGEVVFSGAEAGGVNLAHHQVNELGFVVGQRLE